MEYVDPSVDCSCERRSAVIAARLGAECARRSRRHGRRRFGELRSC